MAAVSENDIADQYMFLMNLLMEDIEEMIYFCFREAHIWMYLYEE